ncbi:hypothetical protein ACJMK2_022487 [Sinanodonta woodiana]|uniref:C1q domain-containing protein n=1 Tax=Sinanodonta woodiana TaxID=1069815 RepID=A0ABD3TKI5_SINWO
MHFGKGREGARLRLYTDERYLFKISGDTESLEKTIDIAKSMIQSMETKLSEAHKYVGMLEDKLKVCGQNSMLTEHLEKKPTPFYDVSKEHIMNIVEDRLIKLKQQQILHSENVTRMLIRMENRLSNIDVLEAKLHKAESAISRVEAELEKNINVLEYKHVAISQKSNVYDIAKNASGSDVEMSTITKENSDNDVIVDRRNDRKNNEINQVYSPQASDVGTDILRGFRAATDNRVAFRVSGQVRHDGHYSGERIVFDNVDYNEGSGYDMKSGTFTCPTTGTYFFTSTIGSYGKVYIDAVLKIDGVVKFRVYAGYHLQGDNMSTAVTITHCRVGQTVWLEVATGDHLGGWESMSGFLLWPEIASS